MHKDIEHIISEEFTDIKCNPNYQARYIYRLASKACPHELDRQDHLQLIEDICLTCDEDWSDSQKVRYIKNQMKRLNDKCVHDL